VGLLVTTKGPPTTTFTLGTGAGLVGAGGGTIDTVGGPVMFLDPITVKMMPYSVISWGSVVAVGPV